MLTRRAVLKGTAAVSIGAIAAAHGAAPAEAESFLDMGFGQLTGGAIGGFAKLPDAFQIAFKFDMAAADISFTEQLTGGVAVYFKYFSKSWTTVASEPIDLKIIPDLKTSELYFAKLDKSGAEMYIKDPLNPNYIYATIDVTADEVFFKYDLKTTDIIIE